jgi:hypothetical protein
MTGQDRFVALDIFFEHRGLIAGLVRVSMRGGRQALNRYRGRMRGVP